MTQTHHWKGLEKTNAVLFELFLYHINIIVAKLLCFKDLELFLKIEGDFIWHKAFKQEMTVSKF